ncbi:MAG: twin-arginine translocase TatA/TatE family subunit [Dehalococcoidia bacterium]|nr:twin-arginine translocase TatA/TatE family subunit [Dehalococcoidia bacterium]
MPFKLGPLELVIILVIVLVIFGAGKLPEIGSSLGKAIRGFRKSTSGEEEAATPAPRPQDPERRG